MARTYGQSTYGDSLYGVTNFVDGVATASPSASNSGSAEVIYLSDATISASASVSSPTGEFMVDATANTIQGTSSTASAAIEVFDGLASGGGSAVGSTASGTRVREASATSTASLSTTASLQFITNASGSVTASAGFDAVAFKTTNTGALIEPTAELTSSCVIEAVGASTVSASANIVIIGQYTAKGAANTVQTVSTFTSSGREKWEPLADTPEVWTRIA